MEAAGGGPARRTKDDCGSPTSPRGTSWACKDADLKEAKVTQSPVSSSRPFEVRRVGAKGQSLVLQEGQRVKFKVQDPSPQQCPQHLCLLFLALSLVPCCGRPSIPLSTYVSSSPSLILVSERPEPTPYGHQPPSCWLFASTSGLPTHLIGRQDPERLPQPQSITADGADLPETTVAKGSWSQSSDALPDVLISERIEFLVYNQKEQPRFLPRCIQHSVDSK